MLTLCDQLKGPGGKTNRCRTGSPSEPLKDKIAKRQTSVTQETPDEEIMAKSCQNSDLRIIFIPVNGFFFMFTCKFSVIARHLCLNCQPVRLGLWHTSYFSPKPDLNAIRYVGIFSFSIRAFLSIYLWDVKP